MSRLCPNFSVLRHRKLLFVSAVKQIAAQWFPLTSKLPSLAVIVISKPELHYLALPRWSPRDLLQSQGSFLADALFLVRGAFSEKNNKIKLFFCNRCGFFCSESMFIIYDVN